MSSDSSRRPAPSARAAGQVARVAATLGASVRAERIRRRWTLVELGRRAGLSAAAVHYIELGRAGSLETYGRLADALGLRLEFELRNPRMRPDTRPGRMRDVVHSAMGEFEARHLRRLGYPVGIDEPYQHYQFAGRADVVSWDLDRRALLHVENRTGFPDFQEMAGAYNAKRAYLGAALADRLRIPGWRSETHLIAALWSAEVLQLLRRRPESFRSLCPDPPDALAGWWAGEPPTQGSSSTLIVLDPLAVGRQRAFIALDAALAGARPRHRGYAEVAARLVARRGPHGG